MTGPRRGRGEGRSLSVRRNASSTDSPPSLRSRALSKIGCISAEVHMEGDRPGRARLRRRTVLGVAAGGAAAAALPAAIAAVSTGASAGDVGTAAAIPLDNQMTTDQQWSDFL